MRELVRPGARVLIAFDDPTGRRSGRCAAGDRRVLEELAAAGVPESTCSSSARTRCTASGRAGAGARHRRGPGAALRRRLSCHDAEDADNLVHLGTTRAATTSRSTGRRRQRPDGLCERQCHMGFGGGWKSVAVGLSTWRSIRWTHTPDGMSMSVRQQPHARGVQRAGRVLGAAARQAHLQDRDDPGRRDEDRPHLGGRRARDARGGAGGAGAAQPAAPQRRASRPTW